jgi:IPT/TIG domain
MERAPSPRESILCALGSQGVAVVFLILILCLVGCGGGTSSPSSSGSGSAPPFQARAFPGDYFMRLPNWDGGTFVPDEAYDPTSKEVFISNPDMNAIEVYSTVTGQYVGQISVPGPAGLSFSPDYTQLTIGTITPYFYTANPATLHVIAQVAVPASQLATDQSGNTTLPIMPYAMSDGSIFWGMGVAPESASTAYVGIVHLVRYVPATQTFTLEDPNASGLTANPARSGDGNYLICVGVSNAGQALFLYSISAGGYVATSSALQGQSASVAANADGSQFAALEEINAPESPTPLVTFWSQTLSPENTYSNIPQTILNAPVYSRDGNYLYLMSQTVLYALNTQTVSTGYLGISIGSLFPSMQFFDVDETYHLFGGIPPGGMAIVNASQPQTAFPTAVPDFTTPSAEANPNVGPTAGGTPVQFAPAPTGSGSADGIASSMEAYFGSIPATNDAVAPNPDSSDGENFLTATAPPPANPGPVSVLLTDANSNPTFLPDAYTYGPHILRVGPNTASAAGGEQITITAYGLGYFDLNTIHVTIGGAAANPISLNSYAGIGYPEQTVTVIVPPGTPGWANIVLTTPNGTDTLKNGLEYLQTETNLTSGQFEFAVYDSVRNLFYLTGNGNTVAVFNPQTQTMQQPLQSSAVSSGAVLESEAMTPDSNTLLVADPADAIVVIFNLTAGSSTTVKVLLPSDPTVTLSAPMSIAAAADNRAFVSLSPCIPDPVREINLTNLTVQTRPDAASTCALYVPYPELGGSSGDGSTIIFAENNQTEPPGPENVWLYSAASDTFQGPTLIADTPWVQGYAATNGNGSVISLSQGTLDQRLLPLVPIGAGALDCRLNETGSLLYGLAINGSVAVSDTRNGHLLLTTLELPAGSSGLTVGPYRALAIDPIGQQILVATQTGLSYFNLGVIPLAVGTVSPSQGPAGTTIQIKGSGFVSGTSVQIGGQSAACSDVDSETISCTVPSLSSGQTYVTLSNPDGQTYSFESAFLVQ